MLKKKDKLTLSSNYIESFTLLQSFPLLYKHIRNYFIPLIRGMQAVIGHIHGFFRIRIFIIFWIKGNSGILRIGVIFVLSCLRIFKPFKIYHVLQSHFAIVIQINNWKFL